MARRRASGTAGRGARGGGGDHRRFHLYQHDERVRAQRTCDPACLILRTSRFFPEPDDRKEIREGYEDANAKVNEFLYRCVDLEDVVDAHLLRPG